MVGLGSSSGSGPEGVCVDWQREKPYGHVQTGNRKFLMEKHYFGWMEKTQKLVSSKEKEAKWHLRPPPWGQQEIGKGHPNGEQCHDLRGRKTSPPIHSLLDTLICSFNGYLGASLW